MMDFELGILPEHNINSPGKIEDIELNMDLKKKVGGQNSKLYRDYDLHSNRSIIYSTLLKLGLVSRDVYQYFY